MLHLLAGAWGRRSSDHPSLALHPQSSATLQRHRGGNDDDGLVRSRSSSLGVVASSDSESDGAHAGGAAGHAGAGVGEGVALGDVPAIMPAGDGAESDDGIVAEIEQIVGAQPGGDPDQIFRSQTIEGIRYVRENFDSATNPARSYRRMAVYCECARHGPQCAKRRGIGPNQQTLGVWQPIAFLAVWASKAEDYPDAVGHLRFAPTLGEQRAWMDARQLR